MDKYKLKTFTTVQRNLASVGFIKDNCRFHTEQKLRTLEGFLAVILSFLYLFFHADTVKEYMDSIFVATVGRFLFFHL